MSSSICAQCGGSKLRPSSLCDRCAAAQHSTLMSSPGHRTGEKDSGPAPGTAISYFGDFDLISEIARGGMGVVWKARQRSLQRDVALKMIRSGALAGSAEVTRFLREAQAAANLQHPHIVAIHEVGEHQGQHYFTMDLVEGRDLAATVREGLVAPDTAARYVQAIAEAMHFAHQRGTLHRDLKPHNVLIDQNDQPRITDFGLAKLGDDDVRLTQQGAVIGTPSYMSPEQASGELDQVGVASDVYSLGAILYELLTGRPPFCEPTALATLRKVMETEPASPRRLNPNAPADLETICLKCLEKLPAARFPNAQAVADELARFRRGEPIQARRASIAHRAWNWITKRPAALAVGAAILIAAQTFGVFYLVEENSFLRARIVNSALDRSAGLLTESLASWTGLHALVVFASIYFLIYAMACSRGIAFRQMFDPAQQARPLQPMGKRLRYSVAANGFVLLAIGISYLGLAIRAHVWEAASLAEPLLHAFGSIFFGSLALASVVRDAQISRYGVRSRALDAQQQAALRSAMEDFDLPRAIRIYREAHPEASAFEASDYASRLAVTLRGANPGKFVPVPITLKSLNWRWLGAALLVEAAVVAIAWTLYPPQHPIAFGSYFLAAATFSIGISAAVRVKGFWRQTLYQVPSLLLFVTAAALSALLEGDPPRQDFAIGAGFALGLMLTACALIRSSGVKTRL
jgi:tRNA A-37 threonylcarbamoyl transferase component Bud32